MGTGSYLLLVTILLLYTHIDAGRVLIFPYGHGYTSRLVDFRKMAHLLRNQGHQITFLVNAVDRKHLDSVPNALFRVFPAPPDRVTIMEDKEFKTAMIGNSSDTQHRVGSMATVFEDHLRMCDELLSMEGLVMQLKDEGYELFIVDILDSCSRILTLFLDIPTISYTSTGFIQDDVAFPNLPSFIPTPLGTFTAEMTFLERVQNTVFSLALEKFLGAYYFDSFEQLQKKHGLYNPQDLEFRKGFVNKLHLVHADFALDYPRPLLPNVVLVGGMFVPEPQPLQDDLEKFVSGAGHNGVVIVSFGSLIRKVDQDKTRAIARSLAKLEQRVIWKYMGTPPKGLGVNTRLMKWLPQGDLLGHAQTRLFVTHCGVHSTYETAWHGVPVIAIPIFFDQHDNRVKLVQRAKMGVLVEFSSLSEESLGAALAEAIANPKYKENAMETSRMLKDHPQTPKERFIYWAEKVMRNKGIGKLALKPMKNLGTFQLYCLDVALFLIVVLIIILGMIVYLVRTCWHWIYKRIFNNSKKVKLS